jgi:hypothetical protein
MVHRMLNRRFAIFTLLPDFGDHLVEIRQPKNYVDDHYHHQRKRSYSVEDESKSAQLKDNSNSQAEQEYRQFEQEQLALLGPFLH